MFTCSLCGARHPATDRDASPIPEADKIIELRAAWLRALSRCSGLEGEAWERASMAEMRASLAYFGACFRTDAWKLPSSITTGRGKGLNLAYFFHCIECPPTADGSPPDT